MVTGERLLVVVLVVVIIDIRLAGTCYGDWS